MSSASGPQGSHGVDITDRVVGVLDLDWSGPEPSGWPQSLPVKAVQGAPGVPT